MIRLIISKKADLEIEKIGDFIAQENPARSVTFVTELHEAIARIPLFPSAYPKRDDLMRGSRMAVHGHYVILFRATETAVRILRVVHGARDLPKLLRR